MPSVERQIDADRQRIRDGAGIVDHIAYLLNLLPRNHVEAVGRHSLAPRLVRSHIAYAEAQLKFWLKRDRQRVLAVSGLILIPRVKGQFKFRPGADGVQSRHVFHVIIAC